MGAGAGVRPEGGGREDGGRRGRLVLRRLRPDDAGRLGELDRSEHVAMLYAVDDATIVPLGRGEEVPQWSGSWLDDVVAFARRHLESGGAGFAAFDGDRLAAVAIIGAAPVGGDAGTLQLALLHVGRPYRRRGVASRLLAEARAEAGRRGARRLYISATPSESALGFYLARGARLAAPPDPGLLALEPEDVHLILDL